VSALEPQIRELFGALDHAGELGASAGARIVGAEAGREALGTRVRFALRIAEDRLLEVRYRAYGCPHTLATCEWLARTLEGRRLDALALGNPREWAQRLGVPEAKLGRLLVVEDALRAALTQS
jgi:NifU-like protein involved in Fe-S cluster formation